MPRLFVLFLSFCLTGPPRVLAQVPTTSLRGETQGTTYFIKYLDDQNRNFQPQIDSLLTDFDRCLSTYRADSEISYFNQSTTSTYRFVRPYFYPVLQKAREVFDATGGAFDPTVLPLVEAYGFGPERKRVLDPARLDSVRQYVGLGYLVFDEQTVTKKKPHIRLDFNALAQGYAVDVLAEFLQKQGIEKYLVEIGGELRARGTRADGKPWVVGIEHPTQPGKLLAMALLTDRALATSGNYRNQYQHKGRLYTHILDPRTGRADHEIQVGGTLLSVTILAADAMTADAFATSCMVLGLNETQQLLSRRPDLTAYLVYTDDEGALKTWKSPALHGVIQETNY